MPDDPYITAFRTIINIVLELKSGLNTNRPVANLAETGL